jgi:hypothetical protein
MPVKLVFAAMHNSGDVNKNVNINSSQRGRKQGLVGLFVM